MSLHNRRIEKIDEVGKRHLSLIEHLNLLKGGGILESRPTLGCKGKRSGFHAKCCTNSPFRNNILNPVPSSPVTDDRRWRSNTDSSPAHEYGRSYAQNYPPYGYAPPYYDSRPQYGQPVDNYGQHYYDERLPQSRPTQDHRAALPRPTKRQGAIGDYKRQRQHSQGSYRQMDNVFSEPKNVPSSSTAPTGYIRDATAYVNTHLRRNTSPEALRISSMDGEAHLDSSGDESDGPSYHSTVSSRSPQKPRQAEGDILHAKPPSTRRFSPGKLQ